MLNVMDWINENVFSYFFGNATSFKINFLNENEVFLNEKIDKNLEYTLNERIVLINELEGKTLTCSLNNIENVKIFYCFEENENELSIIKEYIPSSKLEFPIENSNTKIMNNSNVDESAKSLKPNMIGTILAFYSKNTLVFINLLSENFGIFNDLLRNDIIDFSWNPKNPFTYSVSSNNEISICEISKNNEIKEIKNISDFSSIISSQYSLNGR